MERFSKLLTIKQMLTVIMVIVVGREGRKGQALSFCSPETYTLFVTCRLYKEMIGVNLGNNAFDKVIRYNVNMQK